jgi:four helix bundle protein
MKTGNVIQDKSYAFAVKIVKICRSIMDEKKEFVLSKQLLRSGTAIGALVEEAIGGQTDKDFFSKMTIAYKEARETKYWIRLLNDSGLLENISALDLISDLEELLKIIGSIQKSMRIKIETSKM